MSDGSPKELISTNTVDMLNKSKPLVLGHITAVLVSIVAF